MNSAVVRIKRRVFDEPFEKFVLNCKRIKREHVDNAPLEQNENHESSELETRAIVKLAATINENDDIKMHLSHLRNCNAEIFAKKLHTPDIRKKLREQFQNDMHNQRFKVVNCFRSSDEAANESDVNDEHRKITVVDVIQEIEQNEPNHSSHTNEDDCNKNDFVYDLYLFDKADQATEFDANSYISIQPFDNLVYQVNDDTLDSDQDSEDSNEEAHWRNEYPDTDDGNSINEEDIRRAVEDLTFDSDNSSSSDGDIINDENEHSDVHFMHVENEYEYFKRHGQMHSNLSHYRGNNFNKNPSKLYEKHSSDSEDNDLSTNSSNLSASPMNSFDGDTD